MNIEEAIEWCAIHQATIDFTETYSIEDGFKQVVILSQQRLSCGYIGTRDADGLISCVQRAQRAIWEDWKYQRDFVRAPLKTADPLFDDMRAAKTTPDPLPS